MQITMNVPMTVTNGKGLKKDVPKGKEFTYEEFDLGDSTLHQWSIVIDGETFSHECRARPVKVKIHENGWR